MKAKRNLFGFGKKRVTYHAHIVRPSEKSAKAAAARPKSVRYHGVRIIPVGKRGEYTTSIDRDSRFDDLATAKAFVKSWKNPKSKKTTPKKTKAKAKRQKRTNPDKFDQCVKKVKSSLKKQKRPGNAYAICTAAGTKNSRKTKRNYQSVVWTGKQGGATAEVYKTSSGFDIDLTGPKGRMTKTSAKSFKEALAIARLKLHELASNPISKEVSLVPGASYADTIASAGHRVAKGVTKATKGLLSKIRRKNPVETAVKRYEEFHGYPVNETVQVDSKEHRHSVVYGIGQLICLNVLATDGKTQFAITSPVFEYVGGPLKDLDVRYNALGVPLSPEQVGAKGYWDNSKAQPEKIVWLTAGEDNKQLLLSGGDQKIPITELGFTDRDWHDSMVIGTILRIWYRTKKKFEGDDEVDFYHDFGREGSRGVFPVLLYKPKDPSLAIAGGRYAIALPDKALGNISPGIVG